MVVLFRRWAGDIIARLVAEAMRRSLGQEVIVVNVAAPRNDRHGPGRPGQSDGYNDPARSRRPGDQRRPVEVPDLDPVEGFETIGLITEVPMRSSASRISRRTISRASSPASGNGPISINTPIGPGSVAHLCGPMS